ncbi:MAG: hypothetical protein KBF37_05540 [Saprospiraceae bacterium]|nr:hypothetical protein [Saprospiraceae bacterium]MBV6473329.1 hypothetical protein [Saprospiraceae bacterium]
MLPLSNSRHFLFALVLVAGVLSSCSEPVLYESNLEIREGTWRAEENLEFSWSVGDTTQWYVMELVVEHDAEFPFQNQYVKTVTRFPDSSNREQVLSLELFDDVGRPFGKCRGENCFVTLTLQPRFKFPQPGEYRLSLYQNGRTASIVGIRHIGLRIFPELKK